MEITCKLLRIFVILFISVPYLFPQNKIDINQKNLLDTRPTEVIINNFNYSYLTVSKYLPIFQLSIGDNWFSQGNDININGIPFNVFPLNLNSIELLPVDQINSSKILFIEEGFSHFRNKSFRGINFINEEIPDSLIISLRGYFGSETGDPLVYKFTRNRIEQGNVNKTPASGAAGVSGKMEDFSYRFNAGYYGHFSTGSGNIGILSYRDRYYTDKQNKQIWGSAEANYNLGRESKVSFNGSLMTYYGWDAPPFISNYIHFESYLYRLQASIENFPEDFSFFITKDGSITESHKITAVPPFKFQLSDYSFDGTWNNNIGNKTSIILNGDFKIHTADNLDLENRNNFQNFFSEKYSEYSVGGNLYFEYKPLEVLPINLNVDYHNYNGRLNAFSYEAQMKFFMNECYSLVLKNSSTARFPNLTELYGNFIYFNSDDLTDTLTIKGNNLLNETRTNYTGLIFNNNFKDLNFSAEVYLLNLDAPIEQRNLSSVITSQTGELLRDAVYINGSDKKSFGGKFYSSYKILDDLSFVFQYAFTENKEAIYFPKHRLFLSADVNFPFGAEIIISYHFKSKTIWNNFIEFDSDKYIVPSASSVDLFYNQSMGNFYFADNLLLSARILNIFNTKNMHFPIGNRQDRTIIFSLSTNF